MVTKEDLANAILDLKTSQKEMNDNMDKRHKKTEATVEKVAKLIGNVSNNQGNHSAPLKHSIQGA
jgi:hypothetical protein